MKNVFSIAVLLILSGCSIKGRNLEIPDFNLTMLDNRTVFNTRDIPDGEPFVMMYFRPDCGPCQEETKEWLENMDKMKDIRFYMVTDDPPDQMQLFNEVFDISRYPNVVMGNDRDTIFRKKFRVSMTPYVVVFDKERRAKQIYAGGINSKKLISIMEDYRR